MLKRRLLLTTIACATLLGIAACSESKTTQKVDISNPSTAIQNIISNVSGFKVGNNLASKSVVVFFDTQCPHCQRLWENIQPLVKENKVKFVWAPVGMLSRASYTQGAAILSDKDPVAKMIEHEKLFNPQVQQMGLTATEITPEMQKVIEKNTDIARNLMNSENQGVPLIVGRSEKTGEVWVKSGAISAEELLFRLN